MPKSLKQAIEELGVDLASNLRVFPSAVEFIEAYNCYDPNSLKSKSLEKERAVLVAEFQDSEGKSGVAYGWNTGELQLAWL